MIKIIANKKVDLTPDEFQLYKELCEKYDQEYSAGAELFKGLFESNEHGIITFVVPSNKQKFTMEIYCFMLSVMINQHIRLSQEQHRTFIKEAKETHIKLFKKTNSIILNYNSLIKKIKEKVVNSSDELSKELLEMLDSFEKESPNG